ncbi:zinc finger, CCHC-type containing protein [Tanacetum coccineum]
MGFRPGAAVLELWVDTDASEVSRENDFVGLEIKDSYISLRIAVEGRSKKGVEAVIVELTTMITLDAVGEYLDWDVDVEMAKYSKHMVSDANHIRTPGDYSRPSHEGYRNTIELPEGNNLVPLRSDTIRERTRMRLFQFSLRDQSSNWLEHLPRGSISIWEDLTTRFLAQFFPPRRTAKLCNDILMFQQHQGESLSEAWTRFKDLLQKVPHHGIVRWLQVQIFYNHVNPATRRTIDQFAGGKLHD